MGFAFSFGNHGFGDSRLRKTLLKHFGVPAGEIATAGRQFPITARVDIQSALEDLLRSRRGTTLLGILSQTLTNRRPWRKRWEVDISRLMPGRFSTTKSTWAMQCRNAA
jgi:hypothetical protein